MTDRLKGGRALTDEELEAVSGGTGDGEVHIYWCSTCGNYVFWGSEISVCPKCGTPLSSPNM